MHLGDWDCSLKNIFLGVKPHYTTQNLPRIVPIIVFSWEGVEDFEGFWFFSSVRDELSPPN